MDLSYSFLGDDVAQAVAVLLRVCTQEEAPPAELFTQGARQLEAAVAYASDVGGVERALHGGGGGNVSGAAQAFINAYRAYDSSGR